MSVTTKHTEYQDDFLKGFPMRYFVGFELPGQVRLLTDLSAGELQIEMTDEERLEELQELQEQIDETERRRYESPARRHQERIDAELRRLHRRYYELWAKEN